jgi:hypothetical protein
MVPTPQPCTLPLFDPQAHPQSWNERMADGEFGVLYNGNPIPPPPSPNDIGTLSESGLLGMSDIGVRSPYCVALSSLTAAEDFAAQQTALHPGHCRIYDQPGLANSPLREIHVQQRRRKQKS